MTDASQERVPDDALTPPTTARVLPFERPHSALQRAVQERAQEQVERQRIKPKREPIRLVLTFAVALLPVLLLLGAADAIVRGIHLLISLQSARQPVEQSAPQPVEQQPMQRPGSGVVMLVSPQVSGTEQQPADAPAEAGN